MYKSCLCVCMPNKIFFIAKVRQRGPANSSRTKIKKKVRKMWRVPQLAHNFFLVCLQVQVTLSTGTTLAKNIVTAEIFMRLIHCAMHVKSCDIDFDLRREFATHSLASRVDVEPKLDIAQYHMIKLQINLMNFSAVTIFLARVVFCG